MTYQAKESFHAVLGDGTERFVIKGELFPSKHELVKRDLGSDNPHLFKELDMGEEPDEAPSKVRAGNAAGQARSGQGRTRT